MIAPPSGGLLDAGALRELRRSLFKAVCLPGHQVPYASREMPIARGFGTGGLQITLALIGPGDALKVIDQGADDSVNAVSLRQLIAAAHPGVAMTTRTQDATIIQTRHRIPERPLTAAQVMVYQVPYPDPLQIVVASDAVRQRMHAEGDYAALLVRLYEDLVRFGEVAISNRYPARVAGRWIIDPSPIPRWDLPRLHRSPALHLFGAGREKRLYAVPPHTDVVPLAFRDRPFAVESFIGADGRRRRCQRCGADDTFLDELPGAAAAGWQCSDADWCAQRRAGRA